MTTAAIRERLHDYIRVADDKKIKAIYALPEDQIVPKSHWSEDEEFVAELDKQVRRYEAGIDPGFSVEQARSTLNEMKREYFKRAQK